MPERDTPQPFLAVRNRVEDRAIDNRWIDHGGLGIEQGLHARAHAIHERHLDEDERFLRKRRVEEGITATVRLEPAPQVTPPLNLVHRLVLDETLEDERRRPPVYTLQDQESSVEP